MPNLSQAKNEKYSALPNRAELWSRIVEVLGTDSQTLIAIRLGVSPPSVSEWKKGTSLPKLSILIQIAELGNASLDYLLTGKRGTNTNANVTVTPANTKLAELLATVAKEQASKVFGDVEIAGSANRDGATYQLLVEYLVAIGLAEFKLIDSPSDVIDAANIRRAAKFTLRRISIEERLRQLVREETARESVGGGVGPMRTEVLQPDPPYWKKVGGGEEDEEVIPRKRKTG